MARFGGNEFTDFSVPLVFGNRYFLLEPGDPPLVSVILLVERQPEFEVIKNQPVTNRSTDVSTSGSDTVAVADRDSGRFIYKVRPDSDTSLVFGKLAGGEVRAQISDRSIRVGGITLENNRFSGNLAGVVVDENGGVEVGAPIPEPVLALIGPPDGA